MEQNFIEWMNECRTSRITGSENIVTIIKEILNKLINIKKK